MFKKFKNIVFILSFFTIILCSNRVLAEEISEFEKVSVSNWGEFREAYNDESINCIELKNNIILMKGGQGVLRNRIKSLKISGYNEGDNFTLDLLRSKMPVGYSKDTNNIIKLEDINIANVDRESFFKIEEGSRVTLHFKNIKTILSSLNGSEVNITRLTKENSCLHIFEGNININTREELAKPGSVLIKEGTVFNGYQENGDKNNYRSAFKFEKGDLNIKERYFKVEDNAKIFLDRQIISRFAPITGECGNIFLGDDVTWTQNNYLYFLRTLFTGEIENVSVGKNNKIEVEGKPDIGTYLLNEGNNVEFERGLNLKIKSNKYVVCLYGENNKIIFNNPGKIEFETTKEKTSCINVERKNNSVKFTNSDILIWSMENIEDRADKNFLSVENLEFRTDEYENLEILSENEELVKYLNENKFRKIIFDKPDTEKVAIQYVNQNDENIGDIIPLNYDIEKYQVGDKLSIPAEFRNTNIPKGYHYASNEELNGKVQPEYIKLKIKKSENPKVEKIYIYGDSTDLNIKYVETNRELIISEKNFIETVGNIISLQDDKYIGEIPKLYEYCCEEDLNNNQVQLIEDIKVPLNGEYIIYIKESGEFISLKENSITEVIKIAEEKIENLRNLSISEENKILIEENINRERDNVVKNIQNAISIEELKFKKLEGISIIENIKFPEETNNLEEVIIEAIKVLEEKKFYTIDKIYELKLTEWEKESYNDKIEKIFLASKYNIETLNNEEDINVEIKNFQKLVEEIYNYLLENNEIDVKEDRYREEVFWIFTNFNRKTDLELKEEAKEIVIKAALEKIKVINLSDISNEDKNLNINLVNEIKEITLKNIEKASSENEIKEERDRGINKIKNLNLIENLNSKKLVLNNKVKYLEGYKDGNFYPEKHITRAEVASIIYKLSYNGENLSEFSNKFKDVDLNKWYAKEINFLLKNEVIEGYKDSRFKPEEKITRAEFVKVFCYFDDLKEVVDDEVFSDVSKTHWAKKYINFANFKKWVKGYEDNIFKPDNYITREEAVVIINRIIDKKLKENIEINKHLEI